MAEIRNLTRNGETFYPLTCSDAVLNRDGEPLGLVNDIFDISEYNASGTPPVLAKYDTLSLALAAVPTSKQKGGMTIRYIDSNDNKYVQYRCKTQSFSAEPKDWAEIVEGLHTENNTYIAAFTVGGQILIAFKKDGEPVFGFGVPSQFVEYVTEQINILKDGSDTTDIDGVNKIFEFLANFSTSDTLKNLLDTKVSKELGKSLIQSDVAENMKFIANDEFLLALTDENKAIFEAIRKNGNKYIPTPIETDSFIGKTELSNNTIGFREIDSERKLISYRDSKGVKHENAGIDVGQCLINGVDVLEYIPKLQSPRFIHISDTHLDDMTRVENGVNGQERMALLVGMIKDEEKKGSFDAIICTGDCGMGFTYADGTRDNRLTKFKEWIIDEVSTPVYPVVGNHDGYTDEEWFSAFNLPKQYSVDLGTFYLIVLDVYRGSSEWSAGHTGDPDADEYGYIPQDIMISRGLSGDRELRFTSVDNTWLEQQLITAKNLCKPAIVAMHTWDTGGSLDISIANASVEKCQQLLSEYGCKVRLFGHSHIISNFRGTYAECNPGWFGLQNTYNYPTSPWAINVFEQKDGYFNVSSVILAHNYVDTPRLGNVSASVTTLPLWKDNVGRATFNIIND